MKRTMCGVVLGLLMFGCGGGGAPKGPVGVTGVSPFVGDVAGGDSVTVSGWGFSGGSVEVRFDTTPATGVTVVDDNTITCTTPAHSAGLVPVTVTVGGTDSATRPDAFRYVVPPSISGISPVEGPAAGGTSVTVTGSDFQAGAEVYFGGISAVNVTVADANTITCETPAFGANGAVDVTVVNPDGGQDVLVTAFTYRLPPAVSSLSPAYIGTSTGGALIINGDNFYGSTANTTVNLDGAPLSVTSVTFTQIQAAVPAGTALGYHDVEVVNPDGQSALSAAPLLVYSDGNALFVSTSGDDSTGDGSEANPFRTIGKGLSEASAQGKGLVVLSGVYDTEALPLMVPDGVWAFAAGGQAVVDGGGSAASGFIFANLASQTSMGGFTLTNLDPSSGTGIVHSNSSDVVLSRWVIDTCRLGVEAQGGQLTLSESTVSNNDYGGIYIHGDGTLIMQGCTVSSNGNSSSSSSLGGLTADGSTVQLDVSDTVFSGNTSVGRTPPQWDAGGGVAVIAAQGTFVRCTFRQNEAGYGGALYIRNVDWDDDTTRNRVLRFKNCLFRMNRADALSGSTGGDVFLDAGDSASTDLRGVEFTNCVFDQAQVKTTGGAVAAYIYQEGSVYYRYVQPIFRNCVFSNSAGSALHAMNVSHPDSVQIKAIFALYYCAFKGNNHDLSYQNVNYLDTETSINSTVTVPAAGEEEPNHDNIVLSDTDALFQGADDYHLDPASRCVDAGDPDAAYDDLDASRNDIGLYGGPDAGS